MQSRTLLTLLLCVVLAACQRHDDTPQPAPTASAPITASVSPPPTSAEPVAFAAPIARKLTWGRLASWKGSGILKTEPFHLDRLWKFEWSATAGMGLFQASLRGKGVYELLANEMVRGEAGTTTMAYETGDVYLDINSTATWTAIVWTQDDWFMETDCRAFAEVQVPVRGKVIVEPFESDRVKALEADCAKTLKMRGGPDAEPWALYATVMEIAARPFDGEDQLKLLKGKVPNEAILLRLTQENAGLRAVIAVAKKRKADEKKPATP